MLGLFIDGYRPQSKHMVSGSYNVVSKRYASEIEKVRRYYATSVKTLPSKHVLTRMLYTLDANMELDFVDYVNTVTARAPALYRNFGVGASYNSPEPHSHLFYGENGTELWLGITVTGNVFELADNWRNLRPVRPLLHQNVDLNLSVMETDYSYASPDLSVVLINLPMLAIQYRMWYKEQTFEDRSTYIPKFIKQFVLPNMLVPHTDLVVLNRMMDLFYYGTVVEDYRPEKLPISIVDYTDKVDDVLKELLGKIRGGAFKYEDFLTIIPGLTKMEIGESLSIPDLSLTRQIRMPLLLSRLRYIKFFIDLGGIRSLRLNKHHISDLKRYLKYLANDSLFGDIPFDIQVDYNAIIDELNDL